MQEHLPRVRDESAGDERATAHSNACIHIPQPGQSRRPAATIPSKSAGVCANDVDDTCGKS